MKALVYHKSIPRWAATAILGRIARRRFFSRVAPVTLADVPLPTPGPGFALVKVKRCGICGSDVNLLRAHESVLLEPYASFPAILGHEIFGEIVSAPDGAGPAPGARVVIEPLLPCDCRDLPACPSCQSGEYNLCERFAHEGRGHGPSAGVTLGFNAGAGGGFAEFVAAQVSKIHRVPDSVSDDDAVLVDSIASALQPVADNFPADEETVIVYGAGAIGQHTVRCLRALGSKARIVGVARRRFQGELMLAGGADEVLYSPSREALGRAVGASVLKTTIGGGNLEGGADRFFDCVGSNGSIQDGLLCLRAKGTFILIATSGKVSVDLSPLWFRRLTLTGSNCYAHMVHAGETKRTYRVALELLEQGLYPTTGLLTHTFPLSQWERAFAVVFDKRLGESVKVALDPQST